MQYPSDAFSISWHSSSEIGEHPLQWNFLSRHCSTDKSSSIGSMESLEQPGQNYYERMLSPLGPGMYQNKRDSAYSSFSTGSNISDYTLSARMDESSPINCFLVSNKEEDGQYIQTGQDAVDSHVVSSRQSLNEHFQKTSTFPYNTHDLENINSPPQPPIRRDSLREKENQFCNHDRRDSTPSDSFYMPGMWSSEVCHFNSSENCFCQCTNGPCTEHRKENLSSDQYYMLSSLNDKVHQINNGEKQFNHCTEFKKKRPKDDTKTKVSNDNNIGEAPYNTDHMATEVVKNSDCEHWKVSCGPSNQTNMSSLQASIRNDLQSTFSSDCHNPTDKCKGENEKRKCNANKDFDISPHWNAEQPTGTNGVEACSSLERSVKMPNEAKDVPSSHSKSYVDGLNSNCLTSTLTQDASGQEETVGPTKKPGSSRHRSAHMRRKSDRFATNLRNDIQRRKAQLQKSKTSNAQLSGEEYIDEKDYGFKSHSGLMPPPLPPKNKALLLEIKRASAEKFRNAKDDLNQGKQEGELIDRTNESHKHTIKEIIPEIKEAFTEDEELLPSENKTYNEWWKSKASDTYHQESPFQKRNTIDYQKNTEQKCSYPTQNFQHAIYIAPKPDNFLNEWEPVMWKTDEINTGNLKIPVECKDFSGLEQKTSSKVSGANAFKTTCDNQRPTETLEKHTHVDNSGCISSQFFDSKRKGNLTQFTSEQSVTERKIIYHANLGQETMVHEVRNSDDISSAAQLKSHLNPNGGAKLTPVHKPQTNSYIRREDGQKLNGMNVEESVYPIAKMSDENVLMPFADRRKFFEDVSKRPTSSSTVNDKPNKSSCPSIPDNPLSQAMIPDLRRHSVDHTHYVYPRRQESGLPHYDFCMNHTVDHSMCCNQRKHPTDYLTSFPYGYRACVFCSNDLCPALLKRNIPVTHHSCHCQHLHHHHHWWKKCADYLCPTQHNLFEEGGSHHLDQWHKRKPLSQDMSLNEWNQHLEINRKCSQSVSDFCHFPSGIQHPGLLKPCCEQENYELSQNYERTCSCDLSGENLPRPLDCASFQDRYPESSLSRNRAYSVSELNLEYLALRGRIDSPTTKLEEREPPVQSKKQGPPRPPPPKWEKYKESQTSKQTTTSGFLYCKERSASEFNRDIKDARQRSQSLPVDRISFSVGCNLSPTPIQGPNHIKELSEIGCALQGSQEFSPAASPNRNVSVSASKSKEVDGPDTTDQFFCSESITMEPLSSVVHGGQCTHALEDIFEGGFRCSEDDWSTDRESEVSIPERYDEFQPISPAPLCGTVSPTNCATYYNTSAAKAGLLIRMKEISEVQEKTQNITEADDEENELRFKKVQLIESITRKLAVLHEAQQGLHDDIIANSTLGCELENLLKSVCKPNEYDKFRIFIGDLDKVVSLLLSLSGRMSRVESALNCEDPEPSMEEKLSLLEKKKQLTDQLEDAKELKAHVKRKEQIVLETVSKYLTDEQLQDYYHYVKMTSEFIVEQRELEDKIRLGEEQLKCLHESL